MAVGDIINMVVVMADKQSKFVLSREIFTKALMEWVGENSKELFDNWLHYYVREGIIDSIEILSELVQRDILTKEKAIEHMVLKFKGEV